MSVEKLVYRAREILWRDRKYQKEEGGVSGIRSGGFSKSSGVGEGEISFLCFLVLHKCLVAPFEFVGIWYCRTEESEKC
jgi:hypothetical protein